MDLTIAGGGKVLPNPAITTGLKHYFTLCSDWGDAVVRVAVWKAGRGWGDIENVTVKSVDDVMAKWLFDKTVRKVSVEVLSTTVPNTAVTAVFLATPVAA